MENIILSLLLLKSMTIYELKMYIQKNLSTVCSDSLGSIQSAIKKLLDRECIIVKEFIDNNMIKKQYSITISGVTHFKEWIGSPMNFQKMKNMEEGKLFFLGMASHEKRISFLRNYIKTLRLEYDKLCQIKTISEGTKDSVLENNVIRIRKDEALSEYLLNISEENELKSTINNIYKYQIYMLEYGIKRLSEDILFYEKILKDEDK